jgi:hypothetical protein
MRFSPRSFILLASITVLAGGATGCGLLIGNVKPVDEKSDQYGVADLAKENPKLWTRLTPAQEGADVREPETTSTEIPDVAFQSSRTAAVISINSSCRPTQRAELDHMDLQALTNQLTYGITDPAKRSERNLTIQSVPALESQVEGRMNGNPIAIKTVVLRKNSCVYDLLYMAPPAHFAENEPDFDHFVASLRLR